MLWVISYDVPNDRKRLQVASVLETYGVRVQWSVFECRIEGATLAEIQTRVLAILGQPPEGTVRGYRICERCAELGWVAGNAQGPAGSSAYLVV